MRCEKCGAPLSGSVYRLDAKTRTTSASPTLITEGGTKHRTFYFCKDCVEGGKIDIKRFFG